MKSGFGQLPRLFYSGHYEAYQRAKGIPVIIYEPVMRKMSSSTPASCATWNSFKQEADVIISNRMAEELADNRR